MTKIVVKNIIFDNYNLTHIEKHSIAQEEAIKAGQSLIYHRRTYKERYLVIGRSGTRIITLILRKMGIAKYYLVTARGASKKEGRKVYEIEKNKK